MKRRFEVFADYFQFYLWDRIVAPEAPTDYTDHDVADRIKAAPNVVVIQPARNVNVPVELEVQSAPPTDDFADWDHVAEASLDLPNGELEVHERTGGSVERFSLRPGTYRVRAYYGGLNTLSEDGLDGGDHYRIILWPAPSAPIAVLKRAGPTHAG